MLAKITPCRLVLDGEFPIAAGVAAEEPADGAEDCIACGVVLYVPDCELEEDCVAWGVALDVPD